MPRCALRRPASKWRIGPAIGSSEPPHPQVEWRGRRGLQGGLIERAAGASRSPTAFCASCGRGRFTARRSDRTADRAQRARPGRPLHSHRRHQISGQPASQPGLRSQAPTGPRRRRCAPEEAIPLPLDAINVGQSDDDRSFLLLEVGIAPLMFMLSPQCLEQIGQTLLMLSAKSSSPPS